MIEKNNKTIITYLDDEINFNKDHSISGKFLSLKFSSNNSWNFMRMDDDHGIVINPNIIPYSNSRGVFGSYALEFITISTQSDSSNFGNLTVDRPGLAATSNGVNDRGIFGGGYHSGNSNIIDFITISNTGNASNFGTLDTARNNLSATSNGVNDRGIFGGGHVSDVTNKIDFVTISSAGDASDFGDLYSGRRYLAATSNGVNDRGIFGGGEEDDSTSTPTDRIDFVTISSTGNASNFGTLDARTRLGATSSYEDDRGLFSGGYDGSNDVDIIEYVTISTESNASNFGNLSSPRRALCSTSNLRGDRAVYIGGTGNKKIIEFTSISSGSTAAIFGNTTNSQLETAATSN